MKMKILLKLIILMQIIFMDGPWFNYFQEVILNKIWKYEQHIRDYKA